MMRCKETYGTDQLWFRISISYLALFRGEVREKGKVYFVFISKDNKCRILLVLMFAF